MPGYKMVYPADSTIKYYWTPLGRQGKPKNNDSLRTTVRTANTVCKPNANYSLKLDNMSHHEGCHMAVGADFYTTSAAVNDGVASIRNAVGKDSLKALESAANFAKQLRAQAFAVMKALDDGTIAKFYTTSGFPWGR